MKPNKYISQRFSLPQQLLLRVAFAVQVAKVKNISLVEAAEYVNSTEGERSLELIESYLWHRKNVMNEN